MENLIKAFANGQWTMDETLEKGQARKERRAAERGAKDAAERKVQIHGVSHADAISGTHGYDVHHHDLKTGKVTTQRKMPQETNIRNRNPNATHTLHLPHPYGKVQVPKHVAEAATKKGTFNHKAWTGGGTGLED
jgi:hypothetical protein